MTGPLKNGDRRTASPEGERLFLEASRLEDRGQFRRAYDLYRHALREGERAALLNLGNLFADGRGVRRSTAVALRYYRRAASAGDALAAANIGVLYRDSGQRRLAVKWLRRALMAGDEDAALDLAKLLAERGSNRKEALALLRRASTAEVITEHSREEALRLLRALEVSTPRRLEPR